MNDYYDHQNRQNELIRQEFNKREESLAKIIDERVGILQAEFKKDFGKLDERVGRLESRLTETASAQSSYPGHETSC